MPRKKKNTRQIFVSELYIPKFACHVTDPKNFFHVCVYIKFFFPFSANLGNAVLDNYVFDMVVVASGKRVPLEGFNRRSLDAKMSIAVTANFVNHGTSDEISVAQIPGVSRQYHQVGRRAGRQQSTQFVRVVSRGEKELNFASQWMKQSVPGFFVVSSLFIFFDTHLSR